MTSGNKCLVLTCYITYIIKKLYSYKITMFCTETSDKDFSKNI